MMIRLFIILTVTLNTYFWCERPLPKQPNEKWNSCKKFVISSAKIFIITQYTEKPSIFFDIWILLLQPLLH